MIEGIRVRVRPIRDDDLPRIERWHEEARAPDGGDLFVIERPEEAGPIGLVQYRPGDPEEGWLTFGFIAVTAGQRGRGYGSEAVRVVELGARAERFRAPVNVAVGLCLYFWLRLGYRPAHPREFGWPAAGDIIWMVRGGEPRTENLEPRT